MEFIVKHLETLIASLVTLAGSYLAFKKLGKEKHESEATIELEGKKFNQGALTEQQSLANEHLLQAMELFKSDNSTLRKDVDALKKEMVDKIRSFEGKVDELEIKLMAEQSLRTKTQVQLSVYMQAHLNMPLPMWVKDKEMRMVSVNRGYWKVFLKPKGIEMHQYSGMTDSEIWGKEVGKLFNNHDRLAKIRGFWVGKEKVIVEGADWTQDWIFVKYRLENDKGEFAGIGGIAVPNFMDSDPLEIMTRNNLF